MRITDEKERVLGIIAAVGAVLSGFLPWASAVTVLGRIDVTGFDTGGKAVLIAALGVVSLIVLVIELAAFWPAYVTAASGLVILWVAGGQLSESRTAVTTADGVATGAHFTTGVGLYLAVASGAALLGCAIVAWKRDRALYYWIGSGRR